MDKDLKKITDCTDVQDQRTEEKAKSDKFGTKPDKKKPKAADTDEDSEESVDSVESKEEPTVDPTGGREINFDIDNIEILKSYLPIVNEYLKKKEDPKKK